MPYEVGIGCNPGEVEELVNDALNILHRAVWVLNDYIGGPNFDPFRSGAVRNILVALIGVTEADNAQSATTIRDRFQEIIDAIDVPGTSDPLIHCAEPIFEYVFVPPPPPPPAPPQPVVRFNAYPVELTRINGQIGPNGYFTHRNGRLMWLHQSEPLSIMAYTVRCEDGTPLMQAQVSSTGSNGPWLDIVLKDVMLNNPRAVGRLSQVNDWRPEKMNEQLFGEYDLTFWQLGQSRALALIHEMVHATGSVQLRGFHAKLANDELANYIYQVMTLARENGAGILNNPGTYAHLALGK
ncbi:MAG: hypothetical protein M1840_002741 [Geoglossum simile]|nr:MAG: hypothetical protein M1840_002741 [Geoglossum simile]